MRITKKQLNRIIRNAILQEQAAKAQVPKDIKDRIAKIQDPIDREALENAVDEVWAGERDLSDLEGFLKDVERGNGP